MNDLPGTIITVQIAQIRFSATYDPYTATLTFIEHTDNGPRTLSHESALNLLNGMSPMLAAHLLAHLFSETHAKCIVDCIKAYRPHLTDARAAQLLLALPEEDDMDAQSVLDLLSKLNTEQIDDNEIMLALASIDAPSFRGDDDCISYIPKNRKTPAVISFNPIKQHWEQKAIHCNTRPLSNVDTIWDAIHALRIKEKASQRFVKQPPPPAKPEDTIKENNVPTVEEIRQRRTLDEERNTFGNDLPDALAEGDIVMCTLHEEEPFLAAIESYIGNDDDYCEGIWRIRDTIGNIHYVQEEAIKRINKDKPVPFPIDSNPKIIATHG